MPLTWRTSALADRHRALGSALEDWNGMGTAWTYDNDIHEEHVAIRTKAGLMDVSGLKKLHVAVGRPLGLLLTRRSENSTVTLCHTGTRDLAAHTRGADVIVAAAGVPGIISADMVKPGAAVLDVGVSRVDGKVAGDVADDVWDVAGWVSPNPGGVGPMTRAMLLSNIVTTAEQSLA